MPWNKIQQASLKFLITEKKKNFVIIINDINNKIVNCYAYIFKGLIHDLLIKTNPKTTRFADFQHFWYNARISGEHTNVYKLLETELIYRPYFCIKYQSSKKIKFKIVNTEKNSHAVTVLDIIIRAASIYDYGMSV